MKTHGNTILITGGGSGIGEALAHRFHDAGNTVIVAGRRRDALERAIAGRENMHAIELDVESAGGITDFTRRLLAEYPAVNVLIKELVACAVLSPVMSMVCDPDMWNQLMEGYVSRTIIHVQS